MSPSCPAIRWGALLCHQSSRGSQSENPPCALCTSARSGTTLATQTAELHPGPAPSQTGQGPQDQHVNRPFGGCGAACRRRCSHWVHLTTRGSVSTVSPVPGETAPLGARGHGMLAAVLFCAPFASLLWEMLVLWWQVSALGQSSAMGGPGGMFWEAAVSPYFQCATGRRSSWAALKAGGLFIYFFKIYRNPFSSCVGGNLLLVASNHGCTVNRKCSWRLSPLTSVSPTNKQASRRGLRPPAGGP